MKRQNVNTSIESFLVMMLMIVFTVAISIIIMEGHQTFERITENKTEDEHARIALSYVNKRIKQNDVYGGIELIEGLIEGEDTLRIAHGQGLYTYIFYYEGIMYECYTDEMPTLALSSQIVPVKDLKLMLQNNQVITRLTYEYQGEDIVVEQLTTLRSKEK